MAESVLYHVDRMADEHSEWHRGIAFYTQELDFMRNRLAVVSSKYTRIEVKAEVESYQNQFIVQRDNLDRLKHDIGSHESNLNRDSQELHDHVGNTTLAAHDVIRDRYDELETTINQLRQEFNRFLAKWM